MATETITVVGESNPTTTTEHHSEDKVDDDDDNENPQPKSNNIIIRTRRLARQRYIENKKCLRILFYVVLCVLVSVYLAYAIYLDFNGAIPLIVIAALVVLYITYYLIVQKFGDRISKSAICVPVKYISKHWHKIRWFWYGGLCLGIVIFLGVDVGVSGDPYRLVPAGGQLVYLGLAYLASRDAKRVKWRLVISGIILQFIFGLLILRWSLGLVAFKWLGDQITMFLKYSEYGSKFVFGETYEEHMFAFQVMPGVIFFGAVNSLLYYWGVVPWLVRRLGWVMQSIMGTIPAESFIAAANIFTGPTVSVLTVASFLPAMTMSELHSAMTSGFSTVDFGLLPVYTSFGIQPSHLVAASFMSAPAALAMGRLLYPETQEPSIPDVKRIHFDKPKSRNAIAAFSEGASSCIQIVGSIIVNIIAFVAMLYFLNATLAWLGNRVGLPNLSFQLICSYVFFPLPLLMGIEIADCRTVAQLIGTKFFLNDIVAYSELGILIANRATGIGPTLSPRSEVIATYALCGFANLGDVGIVLGSFGVLVPKRTGDLAKLAMRSMIAGNLACFLTACIAGMLYKG